MARVLVMRVTALAPLAAMALQPQITPQPELYPRADASILGYISTSGASELTDLRSCDFPATLTQSGSYAQCCDPKLPCDFFTSCSDGNVIADSTSIFCDWGYCNTAVIVSTAGAQNGKSVLGCWATDLGKGAFDLVQNIGSATAAPSSTKASSGTEKSSSATPTESSESNTETSSSSSTSESAPSSSSPGAAAGNVKPLVGFAGFIAGLVAVL